MATSTATGSGVADPEGEVGMILGQQDLEHERKLSARVAFLPHGPMCERNSESEI